MHYPKLFGDDLLDLAQSGDPEALDRWHCRQMGEAVKRMVSSYRYEPPGLE